VSSSIKHGAFALEAAGTGVLSCSQPGSAPEQQPKSPVTAAGTGRLLCELHRRLRRWKQCLSVVSAGGWRGPEELTGSQFKKPQGTDIWAPQSVHTEPSIWWPNRKVIQSHLPNKQELCEWPNEWGHLQGSFHKGIGHQLPIASGPSCL